MLYVEVNCQAQCSSGIGSNSETELTAAPVTTTSFFLNTDYPAPCSGTVERWRFCFYRPATHKNGDRYRLALAVYRPIGSGNSTQYEIVEASLRTITRRFPANSTSNFICLNLNLQATNRSFDIEVGDITGVCIFNPTDSTVTIEPMHIISEANGYSLLQNKIPVQCSFNSVSSVNISSSQLSRVESRLLHLSTGMFTKADDCINVVHGDFC